MTRGISRPFSDITEQNIFLRWVQTSVGGAMISVNNSKFDTTLIFFKVKAWRPLIRVARPCINCPPICNGTGPSPWSVFGDKVISSLIFTQTEYICS